MIQSPMISLPLKATNDIDWITPLKGYIQKTYSNDPECFAQECATIHRLRQDIRGAEGDSIPGRDMLYRYYGQLELLDLRFPVDEQNIKIPFTWFDAFTHKPTTQYSLAFEKASVIFNISAVLSRHGALQIRADETAIKTAYHSFQASAGMLTYINENFLHAPSFDLGRDTVKVLISIMLAQAQESFLEKQAADKKKAALLAKLASQSAYLYGQAADGMQENVNRAVFEKAWLLVIQLKMCLFNSKAHYFQALVDSEANHSGTAVSRLRAAESTAKDADRISRSFPSSVASIFHSSTEAGVSLQELTKRQLAEIQEKLHEMLKDNDFVYHQIVPAEASLPPIAKLSAAKPITVSEMYAGQDMSRITGPDLFSKIVPIAVTKSASLYDEEKARLVRAETERAETANGEMAASLDYLRLPGALRALKGGFEHNMYPDDDFRQWCIDVADHESPGAIFDWLKLEKESILSVLEKSSKQLDVEESVCEKMRSKYDHEWSQQPSVQLNTTLRGDIAKYCAILEEAMQSDKHLAIKLRHSATELSEMRRAGREGEVDQLFHRALATVESQGTDGIANTSGEEQSLLDADFGEGGLSVADQIDRIEEILKKLSLVKRERNQVLKDLKEKIRSDDISQVLVFNKRSISNYEAQLFEQELGKFRPHQDRLLQAKDKQSSLLKDLSTTFNALLLDKRVQSEQGKNEAMQRQRSSAIKRYKSAYQQFLDLEDGLHSAKKWYGDMRETVESLMQNVETFVNNRRSEGAQLLNQIEGDPSNPKSGQTELEREQLCGLKERMPMRPARSPSLGLSDPVMMPAHRSGIGSEPVRYPQPSIHRHYLKSTSPTPARSGPLQQRLEPPPSLQIQPQQCQQLHEQQQSPQSRCSSQRSQECPQQQKPPQSYVQTHLSQQKVSHIYPGELPANPYSQSAYNSSQYDSTPGPAPPSPDQSNIGLALHRGPVSPLPKQFEPVGQYRDQPLYPVCSSAAAAAQHPEQDVSAPTAFVPPPPPLGPPPLGPQQTIYGNHEYEGVFQRDQRGPGLPPKPIRPQHNNPWSGLNAWG